MAEQEKWKRAAISPEASLADAIRRVDGAGLQTALVLDEHGKLLGILTDGNIRRAILSGHGLNVSVTQVMNPCPATVPVSTPRSTMLELMRRKGIHQLPLTDDAGLIAGLVTIDELIEGVRQRENWVVLMAGGMGTRLHPHTHNCPKPLLPVGGKPILETIVESFSEQGFNRIFLSVNYKAEMIQSYFGVGDRWGVQFEYLLEKSQLGTGGALSLLPERPVAPFIVMNGDLLTNVNFDNLLRFHEAQEGLATMAVREYDFQVPYGVVRLDNANVVAIDEKPVQKFFVNAGIYVLSPKALDYLPTGTSFDMPTLLEHLVASRQSVSAYPLREYWLDIGRVDELERAQQEWPNAQQLKRLQGEIHES